MIILSTLTLIPSTALANAGTPLMWASMLHLVVGNLIIGVFEGLLLAKFSKCPKRKSILLLIGANYLSAWLGGLLFLHGIDSPTWLTIENLRLWIFLSIASTFLLTLWIEFPFFWAAYGISKRTLKSALKATLIVHSISYTILLLGYGMVSATSLLTDLKPVPLSQISETLDYDLYYLSPEGDRILKTSLRDPSSSIEISKVAVRQNAYLFSKRQENGQYDLRIGYYQTSAQKEKEILVRESFSNLAAVQQNPSDQKYQLGGIPSFGQSSDWKFAIGFWSMEGLKGIHEKTQETIRFALETPLISWRIPSAIHLPEDYVVVQLGEDQICIIHPVSRRIAFICRGKDPVVAIP